MNKLSTTALILIAIALIYIFRDKLRNFIAPVINLNVTQAHGAQEPCNCTQTQPLATPHTTPDVAPDTYEIDEDLAEVLAPSGGNGFSVPYSVDSNTIY